MSEGATELHYEPRKSVIRRRHVRIALVCAVMVSAIVLFVYRSAILQYVATSRFLWQQHRQLNFTIDPNRVVYEEDPVRGARLMKERGYSHYPCDSGNTYTLWRPSIAEPVTQPGALLFMHERQTETGQCLLLVVSVWRAPKDSRVVSKRDHLIFSMEEFHIANRNSPRYWARDGDRIDLAELDPGGRDGPLRLFGGQVDPNDPTHFTIRYQIGSKEGVIDGYEAEGRLGEYGRKEPGRRLEIRKEKTGSLK